jgi:hypothetical protein
MAYAMYQFESDENSILAIGLKAAKYARMQIKYCSTYIENNRYLETKPELFNSLIVSPQ